MDDLKPVLLCRYFTNLGELVLWVEMPGLAGQKASAGKADLSASTGDWKDKGGKL